MSWANKNCRSCSRSKIPDDSHLTERGKLILKGLLASREVQSHCLADVSGSLVWVSGPCEAVVPFNYSKRENILGVRFLLQCRCMEGTIVLRRRVKKVIAIKWLQSLTGYWFYYISVLPWEKKEHTRSNKNHLIGAECGRITLGSTCAPHWSSRHLEPMSIQRVALDCVAPQARSRVCAQPVLADGGRGRAADLRWPLHSQRQIRSIIPALLDVVVLPLSARKKTLRSSRAVISTQRALAISAVEVDNRTVS